MMDDRAAEQAILSVPLSKWRRKSVKEREERFIDR